MWNRNKLFGVFAAATLMALTGALPAQAQATRTWVSGTGSDLNPCSYTAPCKTFAAAITNTAAGGEIDAISPGGYGTFTITKNITIDGGAGQVASILASGTNAINVTGSGIVVTVKNLSLNGLSASSVGINFTQGAQLNVINCDIMGMTSYGIGFVPTNAGAKLFVSNTTIHNGAAYGIVVAGPTSGSPALATLDTVKLFQNGIGFLAQDNTNTSISRSNMSNNSSTGVFVLSSGANAFVSLDSSTVANNGGYGLQVSGNGVPRIRLSNTFITGNVTASMSGAGFVFSFGNNHIVDNGIDTPPGGGIIPPV